MQVTSHESELAIQSHDVINRVTAALTFHMKGTLERSGDRPSTLHEMEEQLQRNRFTINVA